MEVVVIFCATLHGSLDHLLMGHGIEVVFDHGSGQAENLLGIGDKLGDRSGGEEGQKLLDLDIPVLGISVWENSKLGQMSKLEIEVTSG